MKLLSQEPEPLNSDTTQNAAKETCGSAIVVLLPEQIESLESDSGFESESYEKESNCSRSVRFSSIDIRHYEAALGDHPECGDKLPISLGWEYSSIPSVTIDDYEEEKRINNSQRKGRRRRHGRIIPFYEKRQILLKNGYTDEQLTKAMRNVEIDKSKRERTKVVLNFFKKNMISKLVRQKSRNFCLSLDSVLVASSEDIIKYGC